MLNHNSIQLVFCCRWAKGCVFLHLVWHTTNAPSQLQPASLGLELRVPCDLQSTGRGARARDIAPENELLYNCRNNLAGHQ